MKLIVRKGDTKTWTLVQRVYDAIKGLEDGCTTQDLSTVLEVPLTEVSSAVSALVLAQNAPVTGDRLGQSRVNLRVTGALPDALYENPDREKRKPNGSVAHKPIDQMSRGELLRLKIQVNEALSKQTTQLKLEMQ